MIRFVKSKEVDYAKWDHCISNSPQQFIFVYSWYLDAACPNWGALILNDYEAVFPLASASKLAIKYLYQPFFTRHFGVYSKIALNKSIEQEFFYSLPKEFQYWDFCLHTHHKTTPEKVEVKQRIYQQLDLSVSFGELRKKYSENALRNIKRAEKNKLKVDKEFKTASLIKDFKQSQGKKLSFTEKEYTSLKKIMSACDKNTKTYCWAARGENKEAIAGAYFMEINNRIIYLKGFSTEDGKKKGAMHFLFDSFIQSQSNQNKVFDFGGSSVASVARFYKNFGATDSLYLHIHSNRLPKFIRWIKSS